MEDADALNITIAGSDVYVAGYDNLATPDNNAVYWKNGTQVVLAAKSVAFGIAVNGTDVVASGITYSATGINTAKYWKNGTEVSLTNGSKDAYANAVFLK